MTTPRSPEGEMLDIMALDRDIEQLRLGGGGCDDPVLDLLLDLREEVDARAAILLGTADDDAPLAPVGELASRRRLRRRLAVVPLTGALVLASTGVAAALSGSPQAPLYPLHRLIFGATPPSSAAKVEQDLAAAQNVLDQAAAEPYASRGLALGQAHVWLADAQRLLSQSGSQQQTLSIRLSAELALLAKLETPPTTIAPAPTPAPTRDSGESSSAPEANGNDGAAEAVEPATGGESEAPEAGAAQTQNLPVQTESAPTSEPSDSSWAPPSSAATQSRDAGTDDPAGSETEAPRTGASPGVDR